jgi:hypothetical protein
VTGNHHITRRKILVDNRHTLHIIVFWFWRQQVSVQRRNHKNEKCFDRELWREKMMSLGWGKVCIHRKIHTHTHTHTHIYIYI